jgi:hypothetical protein
MDTSKPVNVVWINNLWFCALIKCALIKDAEKKKKPVQIEQGRKKVNISFPENRGKAKRIEYECRNKTLILIQPLSYNPFYASRSPPLFLIYRFVSSSSPCTGAVLHSHVLSGRGTFVYFRSGRGMIVYLAVN